jgi:uracil-DNA glycosylase family 4
MANEDHSCKLCPLHLTANPRSVCLKGEGNPDADLAIYFDSPNFLEDRMGKSFRSDAFDWLTWCLNRMSISIRQVYFDYVLKCYSKGYKDIGKKAYRAECIEQCATYRVATLQQVKPKVIVAMGAHAIEAFLGTCEMKEVVEARWEANEPFVRQCGVDGIWATYSPAYPLQDPAASVGIYRTIFSAAEEAGLNPTFNDKLPHYDFGT